MLSVPDGCVLIVVCSRGAYCEGTLPVLVVPLLFTTNVPCIMKYANIPLVYTLIRWSYPSYTRLNPVMFVILVKKEQKLTEEQKKNKMIGKGLCQQ